MIKKKRNKSLCKTVHPYAGELLIISVSVSYTHLDVYKRQALDYPVQVFLRSKKTVCFGIPHFAATYAAIFATTICDNSANFAYSCCSIAIMGVLLPT